MKSKYFALIIALLAVPWFVPVAQGGSGYKIELLTTFDYPDSNVIFTIPLGINGAGDIAGYTLDANRVYRGFVRYADGAFSAPIIAPNENNFTVATGITNSGTICGYYKDASGLKHGFILSEGTFTQFDVPNATQTQLTGINDAGDLIGAYYSGSTPTVFVYIDGVVRNVVIEDPHNTTGIFPGGINNADEFVGSYYAPNFLPTYGFVGLAPKRVIDHIVAPHATQTYLNGLNDNGIAVGSLSIENNGHGQGLLLQFPHSYTYYVQRAILTVFTGINNNGLICGHYKDNIPHIHGIILQATPLSDL